MTEEEARLTLLQTELTSIQSSIRSFDAVSVQIKGWCVTASLAIGGFAAAYRKPELLIVGIGATIGFYLVNCQFHMIQRRFLNKNTEIDAKLKGTEIIPILKDASLLEVTGTATIEYEVSGRASIAKRVRSNIPAFFFEASRVSLFSLYLFVAFCLLIEMITILALLGNTPPPAQRRVNEVDRTGVTINPSRQGRGLTKG